MELETVVFENTEELNFGNAQTAYNNYPLAKENFQSASNEYALLVGDLTAKKVASITKQEMEKVDNVYEDVKRLQQECMDMKSVLSGKLESLIVEARELEGDLNYQSRYLTDPENIEWGCTLLQEALELRDNDQTMDAVKKAYLSRESFNHFLSQAKNAWIHRHQENVNSLVMDQE